MMLLATYGVNAGKSLYFFYTNKHLFVEIQEKKH